MATASVGTVRAASVAGFAESIPGNIVFGLAATLVVAAAAHVSFPLPWTPVPLTLQPLAVLCVGLLLGPAVGFAAMLAYLAEGAAGLPVFSPAGPGGLAQLFGPTGGYLMVYPLIAAMAGGLARSLQGRRVPAFGAGLVASVAATLVLFAAGAGWFLGESHAAPAFVWKATVLPFLPGAVLDAILAAGIYSALRSRRQPGARQL